MTNKCICSTARRGWKASEAAVQNIVSLTELGKGWLSLLVNINSGVPFSAAQKTNKILLESSWFQAVLRNENASQRFC